MTPYRADAVWIGALTDAERERLDALEREVADLRRFVIAWVTAATIVLLWGLLS